MTQRQINIIGDILLVLFFIFAVCTFPLWICFYIKEKRKLKIQQQWQGYV